MYRKERGISLKRKNKFEKKKIQYRNKYSRVVAYFFDNGKVEVDEYEMYPNARSYMHRSFSTKQERSLFQMHEHEYCKEYKLHLRRRRSSSMLPSSWDDLYCGMYDVEKSWKHSTKRKTQYYK